MNTQQKRIAVIGGGAAGLMAAIVAAQNGATVDLFERQARVGRKLMATGSGRCNISHFGCAPANYHSQQAFFPAVALARFSDQDAAAFFKHLGIPFVQDARGRYYPRAFQAGAVVDVLRMSAEEAGVKLYTNEEIKKVVFNNNIFLLHGPEHVRKAHAVIVACGGEASPALGGTTLGYRLLEGLGHSKLRTAPGIVQLETDVDSVRGLRGLRWEAAASLSSGKQLLSQDAGEVQFTEYGVSGPPVLQVSGHAVRALAKKRQTMLRLDLLQDYTYEELCHLLHTRTLQHPQRSLEQLFIGLIPRVMATAVLVRGGYKPLDRFCRILQKTDCCRLAGLLKEWPMTVKAPHGFKEAQVTIGGIDTADFDPETMSSWLVPGLYACGEVLDVDGDCGGYNLQWAWSSGHLAGTEAAQYVQY